MKKNILFVHNSISYVKSDYRILSKHFNVTKYEFTSSKKLFPMLKEYLKFLFYLLVNIKKLDIFFIWFADYHSFLPVLISKIFGKKSILNLGGYDVTYIPELNYGAFNNPIRAFFTKFSIRYANINLAVAQRLKDEALQRVPKANIDVLPTGYDVSQFLGYDDMQKEDIVLTVSRADTYNRFKIKGLDIFIDVAKAMPELNFVIVGISENIKKRIINPPKNLRMYEQMEFLKLREFYCRAKVYAQFSMREGFPSAVCEAMLCKATPVAFDVGAIKEIVGDYGFIINTKDINRIKEVILKAANTSDEIRKEGQKRIIKNFSLEIRERELLRYIARL